MTDLGNVATVLFMESRPLNALLRDLREQQGQSLREAARALDVSPAYLSRVERGHKPASSTVLERASHYYDVPRELLALSRGDIPADIVAIVQNHPEIVQDLRSRYGSR